jgi:hypothetical protein
MRMIASCQQSNGILPARGLAESFGAKKRHFGGDGFWNA